MKGLHTCKHCGKEFKYVTSFIKHEKTHRITRTKRSHKKQRKLSTSKIILHLQGNRKDATETHVRANKKNRKNSEDTNDQDACIVISSCLKDRKDRRKASKVYHCEECGQHFGRKDHLKRHSYSHSEPGGYTCHRCGKTFSTVKNLGKHRMIHSNKTPHVCSNCGTKFKRREHLRRHESLHTNEKPHLCHCCGDTFGRKEDLNTHLGKMHIISRHFLCKACGTSFKDRNALRRHRYHAHTKAGKVFQCESCGLSFGRADHLKRHKHTHSTERSFSCSMCYKVFHRIRLGWFCVQPSPSTDLACHSLCFSPLKTTGTRAQKMSPKSKDTYFPVNVRILYSGNKDPVKSLTFKWL
uniref:C2H2-type domain-containing protein n=1 Tax=Oncorhynchus tshawytscha TaxID=74940 RepID=A0AAZ3P3Q0_ONCTS